MLFLFDNTEHFILAQNFQKTPMRSLFWFSTYYVHFALSYGHINKFTTLLLNSLRNGVSLSVEIPIC